MCFLGEPPCQFALGLKPPLSKNELFKTNHLKRNRYSGRPAGVMLVSRTIRFRPTDYDCATTQIGSFADVGQMSVSGLCEYARCHSRSDALLPHSLPPARSGACKVPQSALSSTDAGQRRALRRPRPVGRFRGGPFGRGARTRRGPTGISSGSTRSTSPGGSRLTRSRSSRPSFTALGSASSNSPGTCCVRIAVACSTPTPR